MARAAPPLALGAPEDRAPGQPTQVRRRPRGVWVVALLVALATGSVLAWQASTPEPAPLTQADVERTVRQRMDAQRQEDLAAPPDAATAYQAALPSLVSVTARRAGADGDEVGTGAGVVVNASGSVLTALHVVEGAKQIGVQFADGTKTSASVLREQADRDIAVLGVHDLPEVVVPAVLGGGAHVGDEVFALGHPLGLTQSLTAGVVSALDRTVRVDANRRLEGLIQFDAAVNPGNSGGPLLNRYGQVVGVVTGLANPSDQSFFIGISFAVPIAAAASAAGAPAQ